MTSALRRSRRAVPAKSSTYNVGDVVEITRNNVVMKGKLAYNLTESPSSKNPRWLVQFDDHKDEELYEHSFGKVITEGASDKDADKTMPPPCIRRTRRPSSSSEGEQPKRRVTFSPTTVTASDDSMSSSSMSRVSAREQRSRRRHAKIEDDPAEVAHKHTRKRSRALSSNQENNKKMRTNDDVVVVKLLTGTLYLYRGSHRRAEFVRRV